MRSSWTNLASTGAVITAGGVLSGMYVNSTTSGEIKLWHGTGATNTGKIITTATLTPTAGYHNLGNLATTSGVYMTIPAGSINITFLILDAEG